VSFQVFAHRRQPQSAGRRRHAAGASSKKTFLPLPRGQFSISPLGQECQIFSWHNIKNGKRYTKPWRCVLLVSSLPATGETGAMGREIESRQGIFIYLDFSETLKAVQSKKYVYSYLKPLP
jgi:hypothetical protein